MAMQQDIAIM